MQRARYGGAASEIESGRAGRGRYAGGMRHRARARAAGHGARFREIAAKIRGCDADSAGFGGPVRAAFGRDAGKTPGRGLRRMALGEPRAFRAHHKSDFLQLSPVFRAQRPWDGPCVRMLRRRKKGVARRTAHRPLWPREITCRSCPRAALTSRARCATAPAARGGQPPATDTAASAARRGYRPCTIIRGRRLRARTPGRAAPAWNARRASGRCSCCVNAPCSPR